VHQAVFASACPSQYLTSYKARKAQSKIKIKKKPQKREIYSFPFLQGLGAAHQLNSPEVGVLQRFKQNADLYVWTLHTSAPFESRAACYSTRAQSLH
jgi:hypothetical protein